MNSPVKQLQATSARQEAKQKLKDLESKFFPQQEKKREEPQVTAFDRLVMRVSVLEGRVERMADRLAALEGEEANRKAVEAIYPPFAKMGTVRAVFYATCHVMEISVHEVLGRSNKAVVSEARQTACYCACVHLRMSLSQVSRIASRDHTTVRHAVKKMQARLSAGDAALEETIRAIMEMATTNAVARP